MALQQYCVLENELLNGASMETSQKVQLFRADIAGFLQETEINIWISGNDWSLASLQLITLYFQKLFIQYSYKKIQEGIFF